jgi:SAM-dependent MidA family methyltransferase
MAIETLPLVGRTELEIAGASLAHERELTAAQAADAILREMQPNESAARDLIRAGLERGIQILIDEGRRESAQADPQAERRARQAAVAPSRTLGDPLMARLVGADGQMHVLLRFTLADWQFVETRAGSQARTFARQKKAATLARELLVREGKATTGELSATALASLRPVVKAAWS